MTVPNSRSAGQQRRSAERRRVILDSAIGLVVERGFASVSISDVGRAAQASKQTIYRHFGDRDGLMENVVRAVIEKMIEPVEAAISTDNDDPLVYLDHVAYTYQVMAFDPVGLRLTRYLIGEAQANPQLGRSFDSLVIDRVVALVGEAVSQVLGYGSSATETNVFLGMLQGKEYNRALVGVEPDWKELDNLRRQATKIVCTLAKT